MCRSDLCVLTILSWSVISRRRTLHLILLLPRPEGRRERDSDDRTARVHIITASDTQIFIETQKGGRKGRRGEKT